MDNKNENVICQNCKTSFYIEPDDFNFYEKIKVPAPTFCPGCRLQRRAAWRNERSLHKRTCDLCKKNIISIYTPGARFPVYCHDCWWSDKWDASSYANDYDLSRPFFDQYIEFSQKVPRIAVWQRNNINSPFCNMVGESKNVYLSVSVVLGSENVYYSKAIDKSSNIFDCYNLKECDRCYETVDGEKNYSTQHMVLSRNCIDSYFLVDCVNCHNCVLSANLRNKEFYIHNKPYTKENYFIELGKMNLGSRNSRAVLLDEFHQILKNAIYRFANILKSVDSTGNNIVNSKNSIVCFDTYNNENTKYCYRTISLKDCMDFDYGTTSEIMYEYTTGSKNDYNVKFSYSATDSVRNAEYTECCDSCTNIFGCISLRNKNNAILNKVYSEKEFAVLREKIIAQMKERPFIDKKERVYAYGEFFPIECLPFAYNETAAYDFFSAH